MVAGFLSANAGEIRAALSELIAELGKLRSLLAGDPWDLGNELAAIRSGRPQS